MLSPPSAGKARGKRRKAFAAEQQPGIEQRRQHALPDGRRLVEADLSVQFGASRAAVRTALVLADLG